MDSMKKVFFVLMTIVVFHGYSQTPEKFNLGFETKLEGESLSEGWFQWGTYPLEISSEAFSGNKSGKILSGDSEGDFGCITYKIPAKYVGDVIQLEGYMKIENVENGFAGLLMRVDGNGSTLAFNNMQGQNISGTKDWEKYSITLEYPQEAEIIYVAGILVGTGKAWFDEFKVTIDGKDLQTLKETEKPLSKVQQDKEFDEGSLVEINNLEHSQIENLALLGRVWGFLKYHHPDIAQGNRNWDYELFRFLPKYLKVNTAQERDRYLINWIEELGEVKPCKKCKSTPEDAFQKPNLAWIEQQNVPLKEKLWDVYNNRWQDKNYYISMYPNVGNPKFQNENPYGNMPFPDQGFRLLSLYRYWNMIYYFFPYTHLMDEDWEQQLIAYIPRFLEAENELDYELAVLEIIGKVQDTHANLWGGGDKINEWKGENFPPVHVRFIEDQLVVTDYYDKEMKEAVGLKVGDVITKINGTPVAQLVEAKAKYYPASNMPTKLRDLSGDLLRSNASQINIEVLSENNKLNTRELSLYPRDSLKIYRWYPPREERSYKMLDHHIGYVTLQNIKEEDIPNIKKEFAQTKGIIIDIRNYPSTFVPFSLGSYFVSENTPFVKFTNGNIANPGEFTFTNPLEIPSNGNAYQGKLVVLVNELSQSQAEYTSMAFRAGDNTTVLGSTTAGADGNVSEILLPGGLRTMISGIGVNYPNGEETQRVGIVPDVEVKPTLQGIRNGKDELLEKAIEMILEK